MACKKKVRTVRTSPKSGPKTVKISSHPRSKPSKCGKR